MALHFSAVPILILVALVLYLGTLGVEIRSYQKPIPLRTLWADVSADRFEPNEVPWPTYLNWSFFAISALVSWCRAQSLLRFSWLKLCTAGLLFFVCGFAGYFAVLIAFDSDVGEIDATNASQGLLAFCATYLASLLALSGILPAVRGAFLSHQSIIRQIVMVIMALVLFLGLACGLLGSIFSISCYIDAKFYWYQA